MENIKKDFITEKPSSPADKPKSNDTSDLILTQNARTVVATIEGQTSGGGGGDGGKGHSSQNTRTPCKMMRMGESKTQSFMSVKVDDSVQKPPTKTSNVKDSTEGLAGTGSISHKRKLSTGGELDEKVRGNEDTPPVHGLQGLDQNSQMEAHKYSSNSAANETAAKGIEVECPNLEKNDAESSPPKIFEFDLNELPADEDEDRA